MTGLPEPIDSSMCTSNSNNSQKYKTALYIKLALMRILIRTSFSVDLLAAQIAATRWVVCANTVRTGVRNGAYLDKITSKAFEIGEVDCCSCMLAALFYF